MSIAMTPTNPAKTEDIAVPPAQAAQDLPRLIERMHRLFLDVVRAELTRRKMEDISPVQAMMLANIGAEEISVGDLIARGYYIGSNASYNLKQLVDGGYIERSTAARDRREARLKLSLKGQEIWEAINRVSLRLAEPLLKPTASEVETAYRILQKLEIRCAEAVRFAGDKAENL